MDNFITSIIELHEGLYDQIGVGLYIIIGFTVMIGIVAQWRLYEKADQPGIASIVPIWNIVVFLKLVGRPASHMWLFLIPVYGQLYLMPKVWIEICQAFGKRTMLDYVLVVIFNGLYILNLGLSYDIDYVGPVYGKKIEMEKNNRTADSPTQLA